MRSRELVSPDGGAGPQVSASISRARAGQEPIGDLLGDGQGVLAAHDEHEVGDADTHIRLDDGPEPVHLVGADPDLHRAADLARVAPAVCAVPVE